MDLHAAQLALPQHQHDFVLPLARERDSRAARDELDPRGRDPRVLHAYEERYVSVVLVHEPERIGAARIGESEAEGRAGIHFDLDVREIGVLRP